MKFLAMVRSSENSGPPPMALMQAIGEFGEQATKAGVLVDWGGLMPTAMGTRIRVKGQKLSVNDGPFAESKEVIGGYAMYDVPTKADALEWMRRFMQLHIEHWPGWEGESELRQLFGPNDVPG